MKNKHTKGEWFTGKIIPDIIFCRRENDPKNETVRIAEMQNPIYDAQEHEKGKIEKKANAKLIVAAPDMLKALGLIAQKSELAKMSKAEKLEQIESIAYKAIQKATA